MQRIWSRRKATTGYRYDIYMDKHKKTVFLPAPRKWQSSTIFVVLFLWSFGLFSPNWYRLLEMKCLRNTNLSYEIKKTKFCSVNFGVTMDWIVLQMQLKDLSSDLPLMNTFKLSIVPESCPRTVSIRNSLDLPWYRLICRCFAMLWTHQNICLEFRATVSRILETSPSIGYMNFLLINKN